MWRDKVETNLDLKGIEDLTVLADKLKLTDEEIKLLKESEECKKYNGESLV